METRNGAPANFVASLCILFGFAYFQREICPLLREKGILRQTLCQLEFVFVKIGSGVIYAFRWKRRLFFSEKVSNFVDGKSNLGDQMDVS